MATVMVPGPEHPRRYVISGRGATEAEAETYGIPEGDPMLVLSEVITAPDGTVTRIEDQAWPADRFELQPPWLD
jgi:DNA-binding GntR family transcriptional regulator